jgi:hypothetical protein
MHHERAMANLKSAIQSVADMNDDPLACTTILSVPARSRLHPIRTQHPSSIAERRLQDGSTVLLTRR